MQYQGPFPDTMKKAENMVKALDEADYGIWPLRSAHMTPATGYLVLGGDQRSLRFLHNAVPEVVMMTLARFIDSLPQNVHYVLGIKEPNGSKFFDFGIHCDVLWKAEAESISRKYSLVWNITEEKFQSV